MIEGTSLAVQWLRLRASNARDASSIPECGVKIPHDSWPKNQNVKEKQSCNKFNKVFKTVHIKKKKNLKKKVTGEGGDTLDRVRDR